MEVGEFAPRPKSCNRDYCAVKGCESNAAKNSSLSFHRFPRPNGRFVSSQNIFNNSEKIDLFQAWKIILKITNITERKTVCSRHFLKSDYFFPDAHSCRRRLKKDAVPSCYLPGDNRKKVNEIRNKARWQRRMQRSNMNKNVTTSIKKSAKASASIAAVLKFLGANVLWNFFFHSTSLLLDFVYVNNIVCRLCER
ncbi:uncharacterized protein LOC116416784 isoform X2 [Nasonia vitripennis]|uniref:THAP-type domain-containing protein n=1 Tax=Nasonia vitripennis TaxID=7425 RepID=A0A7M7Q7N4_NASVI|nr:uncharacterized protein LOC116416784 isoform X2 [Nasonia vitripennis]